MFTKQHLMQDLERMGLEHTDTVFVHSSYKKIAGDVGIDGGADTVVDAFIDYFASEGLVVFPAMSWKLGYLINEQGETRHPALGPAEGFYEFGSHFDVRSTPCHGLGIIPELFRQREGVVRSLCPTSSVCAMGRDAAEFCAGHENAETPLNWNSPWGKLAERHAKILFLGTGMSCNTFMHAIEEYAKVPGLLLPYVWHYTAADYEGRVHEIAFKRHEPHHNWYYAKVEPELVCAGIAQKTIFGAAETHLVDAAAEADYMKKKLEEIPMLFTAAYNSGK